MCYAEPYQNFVWTTKDDRKIRIGRMNTPHLNNAIDHLRNAPPSNGGAVMLMAMMMEVHRREKAAFDDAVAEDAWTEAQGMGQD